jgi:TetR/AcrR family transcriptional regulator, ethionamide resistance regulator
MSNTVSQVGMIAPVPTQAQRVRHREHRETTRRQILDAADQLLRERPYRELTVDTVMAQTGLTRTAFYRHFGDVTDLVLRLFADVGEELYDVAERWAASAGVDYPTPGREGLAGVVDFYVRHGPLMRAIAEAAATDEEIELAYRGSTEALIDLTGGTLERMVRDGKLQVPDARALARAMTLMNNAYLLAEFGREPQGNRDVALTTLETVWLRLATPLRNSGSGGRSKGA